MILHAVGANLRIVRKRQYYHDNNEFVELSVLRYNGNEFMFFVERRMTCALVRFRISS